MTLFRADLHIHSRYSRATSAKLTPESLAAWAMVKGLDVLACGDITHPAWRDELRGSLVRDEGNGLYRLKNAAAARDALPEYALPPGKALRRPPFFLLQGEISSIYKRDGRVRKVHNLVYLPSFEAADSFCERLGQTGNLLSDGRPIVGLDSRHLLEMVLETAPNAFLIPAHIWTPWFSIFGSKSGFDSIEACFGDLASEVFALETGLSSNQDMNRMWSALDRFKLVSNSDAHSGENLGREATLFAGEPSFDGIFHALKGKGGDCSFAGVLEFFPEEGKYHLDGHRACKMALLPQETKKLGGICPVCGGPLTIGVLSRVLELADRESPVRQADQQAHALIPLTALLSEILETGAKSRKIGAMHAEAIACLGPELDILHSIPIADIARFHTMLAEGISRMRRGAVVRQGGYDGAYGVVRVFPGREQREMRHGSLLPAAPPTPEPAESEGAATGKKRGEQDRKKKAVPDQVAKEPAAQAALPPEQGHVADPAQQRAAEAGPGPVLVMAGPGTGKTRTLVERVLHLLRRGENPGNILAVTFTRRAASELDSRLAGALGEGVPLPRTDTLHALAFELWHRTHDEPPMLLGEEAAWRVFAESNSEELDRAGFDFDEGHEQVSPPGKGPMEQLRDAWERIALAREQREKIDVDHSRMLVRYSRQKTRSNLADYTDLLEFWLEQIQCSLCHNPWTHVLVDEIQDLSPLQLALVKALLPAKGEGFFGIGDADQSIYGFRGAAGAVHEHVRAFWPVSVITLTENYRSAPVILRAASALLGSRSACGPLRPHADLPGQINFFSAPTAESEAVWVAGQVRSLIGHSGHTLLDSGGSPPCGEMSPGDIAILVRVRGLARLYQQALAKSGIMASVPENDAFWEDGQVALILREAGSILGISGGADEDRLACPGQVLAKGPIGIAAYFSGMPPFDPQFWQSAAFKALCRAYDQHDGWAGLLNWVHLQTGLELIRSRSEHVQIMTLHAAKGLEFQAVFLPALEDGLVPFAGPGLFSGRAGGHDAPPDMEEERRLLYVGMTRARRSLFLSASGKRRLFGREFRLDESRFLQDIPPECMTRKALIVRKKQSEKQLPLL